MKLGILIKEMHAVAERYVEGEVARILSLLTCWIYRPPKKKNKNYNQLVSMMIGDRSYRQISYFYVLSLLWNFN